MLNGIYKPNDVEKEEDSCTNLNSYIMESGNYKNLKVRLYEIFKRENTDKELKLRQLLGGYSSMKEHGKVKDGSPKKVT